MFSSVGKIEAGNQLLHCIWEYRMKHGCPVPYAQFSEEPLAIALNSNHPAPIKDMVKMICTRDDLGKSVDTSVNCDLASFRSVARCIEGKDYSAGRLLEQNCTVF